MLLYWSRCRMTSLCLCNGSICSCGIPRQICRYRAEIARVVHKRCIAPTTSDSEAWTVTVMCEHSTFSRIPCVDRHVVFVNPLRLDHTRILQSKWLSVTTCSAPLPTPCEHTRTKDQLFTFLELWGLELLSLVDFAKSEERFFKNKMAAPNSRKRSKIALNPSRVTSTS